MPAIPNARHEAYCHARVQGYSHIDSARRAGYPSGPGIKNTAYWVERRLDVQARIVELRDAVNQNLTEVVQVEAEAKQKRRTKITREQVMADLQDTADEARDTKNFTARLRALELLGKEIGMFVERSMQIASPLDGLTAEQLLMLLAAVEQIDKPTVITVEPIVRLDDRTAPAQQGEDAPGQQGEDAAQERAAEVAVE